MLRGHRGSSATTGGGAPSASAPLTSGHHPPPPPASAASVAAQANSRAAVTLRPLSEAPQSVMMEIMPSRQAVTIRQVAYSHYVRTHVRTWYVGTYVLTLFFIHNQIIEELLQGLWMA